jgi:serine/threonine-protein kinase
MTGPSRVGRYAIVRRLSKSMTDVYLAIDTVDNRQAALKLIRSAPDMFTQLVLEAERRGAMLQQRLRALDPRVVEVYEYGDADGYFFVAMQYLEGSNLAQVQHAERRLDPIRAAVVAREICGQLAKFHAWGSDEDGPQSSVVHGDIRPSNIHLGPNDTVRLLDFGIAKSLRADRAATLHNFGSPGYCSPERLARLEVDQQSDLWALGATLYEMLAGAPPYQAEDTRKLERLIQAKRPPRALPDTCPRPLAAIVAKALAPDARQRYPSAQAFHEDLSSFLAHQPTKAESERRARWNSTPTLEAAREILHKATRTLRRRWGWRATGAAAWFLLGMTLWMAGSYGWEEWQARQRQAVEMARAASGRAAAAVLRAEYLRTANAVIDGYRTSRNPEFRDFEWQMAATALGRLVELGMGDREVAGKRALAQGYAWLAQLAGRPHPEADAVRLRRLARESFTAAAEQAPSAPDPHLGLARVYAYSLIEPEQAAAALDRAARLGYPLGPRETLQYGDAYRLRAERRWAAARRVFRAKAAPLRDAARLDALRARSLYARIPGFDRADESYRSLAGIAQWRTPARPRRSVRWR